MSSVITLKQREARNLTFTVQEQGEAVDLSSASLFFGVKERKGDTAFALAKEDADFDKSQAQNGVVTVFLTAADTDLSPWAYVGELQVSFPGPQATVSKSADLIVQIEQAVI